MPTKAELKAVDAAQTSFNAQYASSHNWGHQRWHESLLPALTRPTRHAAVLNQFVPRSTFDGLVDDCHELMLPALSSGQVLLYSRQPGDAISPPILASAGSARFMTHWNLDASSALCAHMLQATPADRILDLCAAPGGKTICLAQLLFPRPSSQEKSNGCLHVNEMDPARNRRLVANLHAYLPAHLFSDQSIKILNLDASDPQSYSRFPLRAEGYDKVLVDAPCSSERHLVQSHQRAVAGGQLANSELARWRRGMSRALAKTQVALVMTALKAVRPGGTVVYSTCSIESAENDGVIEKLRQQVVKEQKKGSIDWDFRCVLGRASQQRDDTPDTHSLSSSLDEWSEETEHGRLVLPDHPSGGQWGPLFFCVIIKTSQG